MHPRQRWPSKELNPYRGECKYSKTWVHIASELLKNSSQFTSNTKTNSLNSWKFLPNWIKLWLRFLPKGLRSRSCTCPLSTRSTRVNVNANHLTVASLKGSANCRYLLVLYALIGIGLHQIAGNSARTWTRKRKKRICVERSFQKHLSSRRAIAKNWRAIWPDERAESISLHLHTNNRHCFECNQLGWHGWHWA